MAAAQVERDRRSGVQTAPSASQSDTGGREIDSASWVSGVTVISHMPVSPSTRAALVTAPPSKVRTLVRMVSGVTETVSLNSMPKVNGVSPSCASGNPWNAAVNRSATLPGDEALDEACRSRAMM